MSHGDDELTRDALEAADGDRRAADALLGALGAALPPIAPPPRAKARLMARIAGERRERAAAAPLAWWSAAAGALAAGLAVAVVLGGVDADARARLAQRERQVAALTGEIAELKRRGVGAWTMQAQFAEAGARAQSVWDRDARRWLVVGSGFKRMPGRDLQFWFITADGSKVPSALLDVHDDGCGMLVVHVPDGLDDIVTAAVTDEPRGGSRQPTGKIQLVCQVH